jgi:hypothetical protein
MVRWTSGKKSHGVKEKDIERWEKGMVVDAQEEDDDSEYSSDDCDDDSGDEDEGRKWEDEPAGGHGNA